MIKNKGTILKLETRERGNSDNSRIIDDFISEKIDNMLTWDPEIGPNGIEVEVHQGIVTLKGKIQEWRRRQQIEQRIHNIQGVKEIINNIE